MRTENPETERAKAATPLRSFSALATCRPALSSFNVERPFQRSVSKTFLSLSSSPSAARSLAALGWEVGFLRRSADRGGFALMFASHIPVSHSAAPPISSARELQTANRNPEGDTHSVCCEA